MHARACVCVCVFVCVSVRQLVCLCVSTLDLPVSVSYDRPGIFKAGARRQSVDALFFKLVPGIMVGILCVIW